MSNMLLVLSLEAAFCDVRRTGSHQNRRDGRKEVALKVLEARDAAELLARHQEFEILSSLQRGKLYRLSFWAAGVFFFLFASF